MGMKARTLAPGDAEGDVLVLDEALSLWGGLDPESGRIIDPRHPQHGEIVSGRVLLMPSGRGSSSTSTVLAEAIRLGMAPAAILVHEPDTILALGSIAARELYGTAMPVVVWKDEPPLGRVRVHAEGALVTIEGRGR
jgi:predicted aconitase with swiveling domain